MYVPPTDNVLILLWIPVRNVPKRVKDGYKFRILLAKTAFGSLRH